MGERQPTSGDPGIQWPEAAALLYPRREDDTIDRDWYHVEPWEACRLEAIDTVVDYRRLLKWIGEWISPCKSYYFLLAIRASQRPDSLMELVKLLVVS